MFFWANLNLLYGKGMLLTTKNPEEFDKEVCNKLFFCQFRFAYFFIRSTILPVAFSLRIIFTVPSGNISSLTKI